MTTAGVKTLTFAEWQSLPETKRRCEVVDGVLLMPPGPMGEHQWAAGVISCDLHSFVTPTGLGFVLTAPYDVLIQREPLRVRQPDIMVVNAELTGIRQPADLVGLPFLASPPLLVVEVISPSNTRRHVEGKLVDYRSIGVPECWLVNFPARTVEVIATWGGCRGDGGGLWDGGYLALGSFARVRAGGSRHFRAAAGVAAGAMDDYRRG